MAAIHVETRIRASAQQVWQALAAPGEAHKAFAGVLKDSRMESEDLRVATAESPTLSPLEPRQERPIALRAFAPRLPCFCERKRQQLSSRSLLPARIV